MRWLTSRLTAFAWGQAMAFIGLINPEFRQALLREAARSELETQRQLMVRRSLRRPAALQREENGSLVPVDRRDLFDKLRAAWREGTRQAPEDEQESWSMASDYAAGVMLEWLRPTREEADRG